MAWFARLFRGKKNKAPEWKDIEYFHESWKNRIMTMAAYLPESGTVMDLGSGQEWLRAYLKKGLQYIAVDYLDRGTGNLVCNFNQKEFPAIQTDYAFISGCLEYVEDPHWFVEQLSHHTTHIVLSYNTTETVPNAKYRKGLAWKNHLNENELLNLFSECGFALRKTDRSVHKNIIYIFEKAA